MTTVLRTALAAAALSWLCIGMTTGVRAGDVTAGEELAKRWCQECHDTGHGRSTAQDGAPAFKTVARNPELTRDRLNTWLVNPHPPMPKLDLSRREIDDLISYIESLR